MHVLHTQCAIYTVDLTSYRFSQIARLPHNADNRRRRAEASIFSEMPHRGGIIDCHTIHNYKTAKVTQILCSLKAETKFWHRNTHFRYTVPSSVYFTSPNQLRQLAEVSIIQKLHIYHFFITRCRVGSSRGLFSRIFLNFIRWYRGKTTINISRHKVNNRDSNTAILPTERQSLNR